MAVPIGELSRKLKNFNILCNIYCLMIIQCLRTQVALIKHEFPSKANHFKNDLHFIISKKPNNHNVTSLFSLRNRHLLSTIFISSPRQFSLFYFLCILFIDKFIYDGHFCIHYIRITVQLNAH